MALSHLNMSPWHTLVSVPRCRPPQAAVDFVLPNLLGAERFASLDLYMAGDDVKEKKPDPSIYKVWCYSVLQQLQTAAPAAAAPVDAMSCSGGAAAAAAAPPSTSSTAAGAAAAAAAAAASIAGAAAAGGEPSTRPAVVVVVPPLACVAYLALALPATPATRVPPSAQIAAQRLKVDPAACLVVEDSMVGLAAALGAGMR